MSERLGSKLRNLISNKNIIVSQVAGGIGNQLFQFYAGYLAAIKSGRELFLDDFRVKDGVYYLNRIESKMPIYGLRGLNGFELNFVKHTLINKALSRNKIATNLPFFRKNIAVIDFSPRGETGAKLNPNCLDFSDSGIAQIRIRGNLQSLDIVQEAISLGAPCTLSIREISDQANEILKLSAKNRPIGIHLRLKDYLGESQGMWLGSSYYEKAITYLNALIPNSPLWLFTDDIDLAMELLPESIKNQLTFVLDPVGFSDVETLLIMSSCTGLIIANSTFSFWAAYFQETQIVVAPCPWFKSGPEPNENVQFGFPAAWKIISW